MVPDVFGAISLPGRKSVGVSAVAQFKLVGFPGYLDPVDFGFGLF